MAKQVLIIDDDQDTVRYLSVLLREHGYDAVAAYNGNDGLQKVREAKPDLIVLDVMMPKLDGFEVCRKIRENPDWQDVRVIMLTAKGRDVERQKGLELGADAYITKPFSTRDLMEKVNTVIGS